MQIPLYAPRSSIDTVVAETGGGKGVLALAQHLGYLAQGKRVGTNHELYLEHFPESLKDASITRIPDLPTRRHLEELGFGSPKEDKNKDNYGGLFWDEVSLFLDSKRTPDFKPTYAWLKQRRKKHWNILFTAQHEDQLQEELYKSLVNRLIVVGATDLDTIPFFAPIIRLFGGTGYDKDGHYFYLFKGKTRSTEVIDHGEYENLPFRKMYNTDQVFDIDTEWLFSEGKWQDVDMRANWTYLPKRYLVDLDFLGVRYRQKQEELRQIYWKGHEYRLNQLHPQKEDQTMAVPNRFQRKKRKMLLVFMVVFVVAMAALLINNFTSSSQSPYTKQQQLKKQSSTPTATEPTQQAQAQPEPVPKEFDFVEYLFSNFDSRLDGLLTLDDQSIHGYVTFYNNDIRAIHERIAITDFTLFDYSVKRTQSGIMISKDDQKFLVTMKPTPEQQTFRQIKTSNNI